MWWDWTWCGVCLFKLCNQLVLRVCVEVNTSEVLVCSTEEFLCELVILSEFVFLHLFSSSVCVRVSIHREKLARCSYLPSCKHQRVREGSRSF